MAKLINMVGQKIGRWTVIDRDTSVDSPKAYWICECECGKVKSILGKYLRNGESKSCGCLKEEKLKTNSITHNMRHTRFYSIWANMKYRCSNSNSINYGGRGIKVCDRWTDFNNFYEDMYISYQKAIKRDKNITIDRINNDGDYEPSNCRWASMKEQNNNKRNNRIYRYKDETLTIAEWSIKLDIPYHTLLNRLNRGWSIEKTLTTPVRERRGKNDKCN